jgi:hypothetical protein
VVEGISGNLITVMVSICVRTLRDEVGPLYLKDSTSLPSWNLTTRIESAAQDR